MKTIGLLLAVLAPMAAATLNFEFDTPGAPAGLASSLGGVSTVNYNDAGFLHFTLAPSSGVSRVTTTQTFTGDFTVLTNTGLTAFGPGSRQGVEVSFEQGGNPYAVVNNIYFRLIALSPSGGNPTVAVRSDLATPGGPGTSAESASSIESAAFFQIARTGTTITSSYCHNFGEALNCSLIQLASLNSPDLGGPVRIGLFAEASTSGSTNPHFRFMRINYDEPVTGGVPEPASISLAALGLLAAVWRSRTK